MTNPIPQDPTVFGAPGHWASGDDLGGAAALRAEESPQDWFFTFGGDHTHPDTSQRLGRSYVVIHGTCDSTRQVMLQFFGNRWSHQYGSAEKAGVVKYGLTEVPMPVRDIWPVAPEHTGVSDVQAEAVEGLRQELSSVRGVNEALAGSLGKLARAADLVLEEVDALREGVRICGEEHAPLAAVGMAARLDRIEQLLRGEQR